MTMGLQYMYYRVISNMVSHLQVSRCERINTAKQKDQLTSFPMLNVWEGKIFQYGFLEEYKACVKNIYLLIVNVDKRSRDYGD